MDSSRFTNICIGYADALESWSTGLIGRRHCAVVCGVKVSLGNASLGDDEGGSWDTADEGHLVQKSERLKNEVSSV